MKIKKFFLFFSFAFVLLLIAAFPQTSQALSSSSEVIITIDDGDTTAVPGASQTYTITVRNNGSENETGVGVSCTLPQEAANNLSDPTHNWYVVSASGGGILASGAPSSGKVQVSTPSEESLMTIVDLPAGASVTIELTVNIHTTATGSISVHASVTGGFATATDTDQLVRQSDLSVTISDGKTELTPGDGSAPYTIIVTNNGPSDITGAILSCPLPTGAAGAIWGPNAYTSYANPSSGSGALSSTIWLPQGTSVSLWYSVETAPEATGNFSATATITPPPDAADPNPGNNSATDTDALAPSSNLELSLGFGNQTGNGPDTVTYDVTVYNRGPSAAAGITVSAPLPEGVTLVSAAPHQGDYNSSTGVWTVGALGPFASEQLRIIASVDYSAAPKSAIASVLTSMHPDPDATDNSASLVITDRADVAVTGAVDKSAPKVGETVTMTITVTNNGPEPATNVWVDAFLPSGLTYVSHNTSAGDYEYHYGGTYDYGYWDVGSLNSGATVMMELKAKVSSAGAKTVDIKAFSDQPDSNAANGSHPLVINPSGNGGSSSGSSGRSTAPALSDVNISARQGESLAKGESVVIDIPRSTDSNSYTVNIPAAYLLNADGKGALTVNTAAGSMTLPGNMLAGVSGTDGKEAKIAIGQGDKSGLTEAIQKIVGDRPMIQLSLTMGGVQTEWNNPDAPVTISIPYTPTTAEIQNPGSIIIWYLDGSGKLVCIPNGHYDAATGTVTFTTTHFSFFAVGYNKMNFRDVAENAWYNKAVSFIAAREITTGTGGETYSPAAKLTRGEFLVMLMKAYGFTPDSKPDSNFADAGSTWYTGYLAEAKRLGISNGVGSNMFEPATEITRQEMFTLLYHALQVIGELPQGTTGQSVSSFGDSGQIAPWAADAMTLLAESGIIGGNNGMLMPAGTTTRAEMAQVLYKLLLR